MNRMELDLFDFARSNAPAAEPVRGAAWEEPGASLWGRAWLANVRRICTRKYASELAFGEKLLRAGRMQSCRVRQSHAQATFTNREGGTALVNLSVRPLSPTQWLNIESLCEQCHEALFSSDDLPDDVVASLFGQPDGLLPELKDVTFSCSHCNTPFCLYRAATLLAVATEFDLKPIKLFELRGATRERLFMRAAQQVPDNAQEQIAEDDLSALFGIDLV
jgi:uncharacterized Zn finger protein